MHYGKLVFAVLVLFLVVGLGLTMKKNYQVDHSPKQLSSQMAEAEKFTKSTWLIAHKEPRSGFIILTLVQGYYMSEITVDRYDPNFKDFVDLDKGDFVEFKLDTTGEKSPRPTPASFLKPVRVKLK